PELDLDAPEIEEDADSVNESDEFAAQPIEDAETAFSLKGHDDEPLDVLMGETREEPEFTDAEIGNLDESGLKSDSDAISDEEESVEDWQAEAFSGEVTDEEDAPELPEIGELPEAEETESLVDATEEEDESELDNIDLEAPPQEETELEVAPEPELSVEAEDDFEIDEAELEAELQPDLDESPQEEIEEISEEDVDNYSFDTPSEEPEPEP
ncbi:hypothetical protein TW74_28155, partial [Vibrio nigripulchritudo]